MKQWPVCHMCGLRCSPTSAWIDCRTPGADREQVAMYYVRNLRGRICDLPGPTLDLIAKALPETTRNFFDTYHQMQRDLEDFVGTRHERREDGHHEDEH